jgi:hypothetical protein
MDARHAPCLNLELVCGGTRSSGYRQVRKVVDRVGGVVHKFVVDQTAIGVEGLPTFTLRATPVGGSSL